MPFTRLVVTSIDGVAGRETAVAADMLNYAGSDLLCYRAASPPGHAALQAERWDPVLEWARVQHQLRFVVAEGVIPVAQPDITLQRMAALLGDVSALPLTALHTITTLTGSAILMLALYKQAITAEAAWSAACVDEEWQASQWGVVEEAATQRARRQREFAAASTLLCLCHSSALDAPW